MKRTIAATLTLATTLIATPGQAQTSRCDGGDPASCRDILAATQAFTTMLVTADPAPLRRHLDPRALWISTNGEVRPATDLIATVSRDTRRATATLDHAAVRFFGDVAVVTWHESWTAPGTATVAGRLAGTDTWVRRGRRWSLVATAETRPQP